MYLLKVLNLLMAKENIQYLNLLCCCSLQLNVDELKIDLKWETPSGHYLKQRRGNSMLVVALIRTSSNQILLQILLQAC